MAERATGDQVISILDGRRPDPARRPERSADRRRPTLRTSPGRANLVGAQTVGELARAAAAGDAQAWSALARRFSGLVRGVAGSYGLNDADVADVSQAVWMRVATHLHTVRDPERLAGWLATIARRESLRVVRQRQRVTPVSDTDVLDRCDSARDPIAELAQQQRSFALRSLIQTLPDHQRKLLDLLMRDPAPSYREVSDTLSIPIGSIGPTRARCIAVLRDKCVSAGIEPIPA